MSGCTAFCGQRVLSEHGSQKRPGPPSRWTLHGTDVRFFLSVRNGLTRWCNHRPLGSSTPELVTNGTNGVRKASPRPSSFLRDIYTLRWAVEPCECMSGRPAGVTHSPLHRFGAEASSHPYRSLCQLGTARAICRPGSLEPVRTASLHILSSTHFDPRQSTLRQRLSGSRVYRLPYCFLLFRSSVDHYKNLHSHRKVFWDQEEGKDR